ncbi:ABC transporter permease [Leptolinea tardivitalis]|uniref:ABC transporter permease n=1 Tax=Leptolinea tardivitalis TaxID=229920 RepID=A0A0P6X281_9CHLR|nr:ABC transporter permease [Leptolinea tardivitalis]KPL73452.1 ABC transporter permease [Leptolinea tardivitalis]GAP21613.1 ABC-type nitrate/sulfonate/bicarbonate transport system, permease component [Leptolinea tardivitalis]
MAAIYPSPKRSPSQAVRTAKQRRWFMPVSLLGGLLLWQIIVTVSGLPAFILPSPVEVAVRFWDMLTGGRLLLHTAVTLSELLLGLLAGGGAATLTGYALAKSPSAERLMSPYLIASQAVPVAAIAPLLVIWFGPGMASKVLICGLTVFFPVLINTIVSLRGVPENLRDVMRAMRATPRQTLLLLEIPAALPVYLAGLRVGATLSVIGAVVGELVGSNQGLGFLINLGRGQYDTALVFVAVFGLVTLAILLYGTVLLVERRCLAWQSDPDKETSLL